LDTGFVTPGEGGPPQETVSRPMEAGAPPQGFDTAAARSEYEYYKRLVARDATFSARGERPYHLLFPRGLDSWLAGPYFSIASVFFLLVAWIMPVTETLVRLILAKGDKEERLFAAGILLVGSFRHWKQTVEQHLTYQAMKESVDELLNALVVPTRFVKVESATSPRLWFGHLNNAGLALKALNAGRTEIAVKALPYLRDETQLTAIIEGMRDDEEPGELAITEDEGLLMASDDLVAGMFTNDVLMGLFMRDMLLDDPLVLTPHMAICLDAFLAPRADINRTKTGFTAVPPPRTKEDADTRIHMYQITEKADVPLALFPNDARYSDMTFRALNWQAAYSLVVMRYAEHWYHRDAKSNNGMYRKLADNSPCRDRPWVYALPPLDEAVSREPRLQVLPPEAHQNLHFEWIDFGHSVFLTPGHPIWERNERLLRYDLGVLLFGAHPSDHKLVEPYGELTTIPAGAIVTGKSHWHEYTGLPIAAELEAAFDRLRRPGFDVKRQWTELFDGAVVHMPDMKTLLERYPNAILMGTLLEWNPERRPRFREPLQSQAEEEEEPQTERGPKRARDPEDDTDSASPERKRTRTDGRCVMCHSVACGKHRRDFCRAILRGQLDVATGETHVSRLLSTRT